jgi:hypothetical protein
MQTKTNLLVFSLATILSLSVVAMGELPQAIADKKGHDEKKDLKFKKKADFTADCAQINTGAGTDWKCEASFWLDKKGENLKYKIQIDNMDLTGWQTVGNTADDVGKVHLHSAADGNAHVLNVWKAPIEDDAQMKAIPSKGILKGIYDDSDVTSAEDALAGNIGHHDTSKPLTANVDDLCNGDFFVMIHEAAGPGVLKGFFEPTKQGDKICNKLGF